MWQSFKSLSPTEIISLFYAQLQKEIDTAKEFLDNDKLIKEYMATLGKYRIENENNHISEYHFINRLQDVVTLILGKNNPAVLDVGSGLGTESLLFGLLGAKVLSVDIHPIRTEIAKRREIWYRNNIYGDLRMEFVQRDIIQLLNEMIKGKGDFIPNIIWLNEAISHIFPPEEFINLAYSIMEVNSNIIISESNPQNPFVRLKNWRDRESRYKNMSKHEREQFKKGKIFLYPWKFLDPTTNKEVSICNEKLWRPSQLKIMLESVGFSIEKINIIRFIPDFLLTKHFIKIWSRIESYIKYIPFLSRLGIRQIIIASK